jgi:hypothetical protein
MKTTIQPTIALGLLTATLVVGLFPATAQAEDAATVLSVAAANDLPERRASIPVKPARPTI